MRDGEPGGAAVAPPDASRHGERASLHEVRGLRKPAASPRHVLVVEDNADAREALHALLEDEGHRVVLAEDGEQGLALALGERPDVALVDIGLPRLDGYGLARRLRETPAGQGIRLIALTGYGQPTDRRRAIEAGFDAFLVKPVDPVELLRIVAS